jgi:hypothetical protein
LSPNDECIGFGQIACYDLQKRRDKVQPLSDIAES